MFRSKLIVEADRRPDFWIVRPPLVWDDEKHGRIVVPAGFDTDLASIPRMARGLPNFGTTGLSRLPAVLHDWLYACGDRPRMAADLVLYDALIAEGERAAVARVFYDAVRLFGAVPWQAHRSA